MLVNSVLPVCTREKKCGYMLQFHLHPFLQGFLPPFLGSHWRQAPLQLWPHTEADLWNDVSKRTHISHSFKYNLYYLVLKKCGFSYLWKLAQVMNSTPLKRSWNFLTTSATAGSAAGNHGSDWRAHTVFAHLKYNLTHSQAWLKNKPTVSLMVLNKKNSTSYHEL